MKKKTGKLRLNRETLHTLTGQELREAAGGTFTLTKPRYTCNFDVCVTDTTGRCPRQTQTECVASAFGC